jgi:hypothetical protein
MRGQAGTSDALAVVELLHQLVGRLPELGEAGALLAAALEHYLQPHGGGTLDDALGLTPAQGAEHWRTVARRKLRDQAILALPFCSKRTACIAPPKKQLRIRGRITSLEGQSKTHLSRVCNHASFNERMRGVVCLSWGSPRRSIFAALSSGLSIAHPSMVPITERIIYKKPRDVNQKNHAR